VFSQGALLRLLADARFPLPHADGLRLLIATAGGAVAVWDTSSRRRVRKLAGHASAGAGACSLAFSPSGACAVSAAAGDRAVAVWDLAAASAPTPGGSAKQAAASAVTRLALPEGMPIHVSTSPSGADDASFNVCAVSDRGEVYVWRCTASGEATGDAQRIRIGPIPPPGQPPSRENILAAMVEDSAEDGALRCDSVCVLHARLSGVWGAGRGSRNSMALFSFRRPKQAQATQNGLP
jgi:hypothetical protein